MPDVIKVPRSDKIMALKAVIDDLPLVDGELSSSMLRDLFPLLRMEEWIDGLLHLVPDGSVTTFGNIAKALGTKRASRAVGELIASGSLKGPVHRIVYADGRIPPASLDLLSQELKIDVRKVSPRQGDIEPVNFETFESPLMMLSDLQDRMKTLLREERNPSISNIAGLDISSKDKIHVGALTTMDIEGNELCGHWYIGAPGIPYIPGFLFYREAPLYLPLIMDARNRGIIDDDTLMVLDGNGVLHPRRMGIACQIGVVSGHRTCGVAKKLLVGTRSEVTRTRDDIEISNVIHEEEIIGSSIARSRTRPVYVSRGHRTDRSSVENIITGLTWSKVPEPTRRAHALSNRIRISETPS